MANSQHILVQKLGEDSAPLLLSGETPPGDPAQGGRGGDRNADRAEGPLLWWQGEKVGDVQFGGGFRERSEPLPVPEEGSQERWEPSFQQGLSA